MGKCYYCGAVIEEKVYRNTVCPQCGKDLKSCINCEFYSPGSHWDCRETIPEAVRDKERANFCDFFRLSDGTREGGSKSVEREKDDHKKAFDGLFGD